MKSAKLLGLGVWILLLAACAGTRLTEESHFSSFEDFWPGPKGGVDLVWTRPELRDIDRLQAELAAYDSVVIDSIFVVVGESALSDEQIQELSAYMVEELQQALSQYKTIVTEPGPNTLRLKIAISNVDTPNPVLATTSTFIPVGLGISMISRITTGEHTNVGEATIEILIADSMDDTPILAAIDRRVGKKDLGTVVNSLDDAQDAVDWWVKRLATTLKELKELD